MGHAGFGSFIWYTPPSATSITSHQTGYTHIIKYSINCKTSRVIYACASQNVSRTSQLTPTTEHNNVPTTDHNNNNSNSTTPFPQTILDTVRDNSQQDLENTLLGYIRNKKEEEPSYLHFSQPGHSQHHIQGLGILLLSKHERKELFSFLIVTETDSTKNPSFASVGFKIKIHQKSLLLWLWLNQKQVEIYI